MSLKDIFHLPTQAELGEFGKTEFANGIADIRSALIDEAWFDRTVTSGLTRTDEPSPERESRLEGQADQRAEDPFGLRFLRPDDQRDRAQRDHPHELDFDR